MLPPRLGLLVLTKICPCALRPNWLATCSCGALALTWLSTVQSVLGESAEATPPTTWRTLRRCRPSTRPALYWLAANW